MGDTILTDIFTRVIVTTNYARLVSSYAFYHQNFIQHIQVLFIYFLDALSSRLNAEFITFFFLAYFPQIYFVINPSNFRKPNALYKIFFIAKSV